MDSLRAGFFGFFGSTECSSSCGEARPANHGAGFTPGPCAGRSSHHRQTLRQHLDAGALGRSVAAPRRCVAAVPVVVVAAAHAALAISRAVVASHLCCDGQAHPPSSKRPRRRKRRRRVSDLQTPSFTPRSSQRLRDSYPVFDLSPWSWDPPAQLASTPTKEPKEPTTSGSWLPQACRDVTDLGL
ncbi:hypothetical protein AA0111_g79 [Alternaria arborescens]|uniref:hypothetical protein n=1 Tax=Alternaria arborescens TaxID=156630 RepID=UPI0010758498|nr:hypothetical protein AA0111_g79 [Alternaria arborescens]RYO43108.1 hypothetical protein AA0111_g79 [Alternaria arborescens]